MFQVFLFVYSSFEERPSAGAPPTSIYSPATFLLYIPDLLDVNTTELGEITVLFAVMLSFLMIFAIFAIFLLQE